MGEAVTVDVLVGLNEIDQMRLLVVNRQTLTLALSFQMRETLVDRNLVEPGRELGVATKILDILPGLEKSILQKVIGIVMALHHTANLTIQRLGIELYHIAKSHTAGRGIPQPLHKLYVVK